MSGERIDSSVARLTIRTGRAAYQALEDLGFGAYILRDCVKWIVLGRSRKQPVRTSRIFMQMMEVGVLALPIASVLTATVGIMLALQGIHTLRTFGAESQVVIGVALGVVREFSPLIVGMLVAGRSGSALAARLATMTINQEVDALRVIGIDPVRHLVVPAVLAMAIMLPVLTFWGDLMALGAAGLYVSAELGTGLDAFGSRVIDVLTVEDLRHGLGKSVLFGILIALIGVINGASVTGGAEGVGRATTRSVVQAITAIVITDMLFVYAATR